MNMYLKTKTKETDLSEYESCTEIAALVMAMLAEGHDWVRLHSRVRQPWAIEWSVLERNGHGKPTQIISQEFDGEVEVITCG